MEEWEAWEVWVEWEAWASNSVLYYYEDLSLANDSII